MFAGRRRKSSNIRMMQLFHELKQQFPTVPDHIVSACIASHAQSNSTNKNTICEILEAAAIFNEQESMGRSPPDQSALPSYLTFNTNPSLPDTSTQKVQLEHEDEEATAIPSLSERNLFEMNDSDSDINKNVVKSTGVKFSKKFDSVSVCTSDERAVQSSPGRSSFFVKRPETLDLKRETFVSFPKQKQSKDRQHNIQLSEKCNDVHKLLNADNVSDKPPRSPVTHKRFPNAKNSSVRSPLASPDTSKRLQNVEEPRKKETASTPTQTTDTLLGDNNVNLSLNVNCSMDLVQTPSKLKSVLQVTPQQSWLEEPVSPRSYTSVNLTLRPPSAERQPPINITSQNSSLTYSTSSFDSQKGLQSRLQITVSPGGSSVSSTRMRPRSSYLPEPPTEETIPQRAGSLNNLSDIHKPPVILKQQARIERLRIELRTENAKLEVMKNEVAELEGSRLEAVEHKIDVEVEKQLRKEIKHLQYQCEQLALEVDKNGPTDFQDDFYHNIYRGQRGPLHAEVPRSQPSENRIPFSNMTFQDEGPKWNCHLCTFLNHPDLDKCEQCEMPRILHGKRPSYPNINYNNQHPTNCNLAPSYSLPNFHDVNMAPRTIYRPIGFMVNNIAQNLNQNVSQSTRPD